MSDQSTILHSKIISTKLKRKAANEFVIQHFRSRSMWYKKLKRSIIEDEGQLEKLTAAVVCCFPKQRKPKGPIEERSSQWWDYGFRNWTNNQFKKRLRVNRETLNDILESMREMLAYKGNNNKIQRTCFTRTSTRNDSL